MRFISLANQTFVRPCRSSTSLILLPMCRLIDRVFWAADDIPISDRHKKSVESIFRPFTHTEVFATHTHRNRQRITTPYRYNKGTQNLTYRYDTPLRSFIVAKFLMRVLNLRRFGASKTKRNKRLTYICIMSHPPFMWRVITAKLYCFVDINKKNVNFTSFFTSKNVKMHPKITLFENQTY